MTSVIWFLLHKESSYFKQEATEREVPLLVFWTAGTFSAKREAKHTAEGKQNCDQICKMGARDWKSLRIKYYGDGIIYEGFYFQNHILLEFKTSSGRNGKLRRKK